MNYSIYSKKALDVVNCQQLLSVYLLSVTASESNLQLASKFIELGLSCVFSSPSPVIYALLCDVCIDLEMINVQIIVALRFKVLNEIDVLLLGRCLVSFGIDDLERTGVIIDHFPVSKCLFECVKEIANHAFHGQNKMTDIVIPNTIEKIGRSFNHCNMLEKIEIPSSVTSIHIDCFSNSSNLKEIRVHKKKGSIIGSPWGCIYGDKAIIWDE